MQVEHEAMELGNVPGLAAQFAEALEEVKDACHDESVVSKGGRVKATITMKVEIAYDTDTQQAALTAGVEVKLPKRRPITKYVTLRGNTFLIPPEAPEQVHLPFNGPRAIQITNP